MHSQSIGVGRVTDGSDVSLHPTNENNNDGSADNNEGYAEFLQTLDSDEGLSANDHDDLYKQFRLSAVSTNENNGIRQRSVQTSRIGQAGGNSSDGGAGASVALAINENGSNPPSMAQTIIGYEDPIMLTASTHSFLFTEPTCSVPFCFASVIVAISYACLVLALVNSIPIFAGKDWSPDNPFDVPVGVTIDVRIAQYLALIIGLIMEEEIPEALYLLRMITEKTLHQKEPQVKYGKFIYCATIRIGMGYLFYLNMFTVIAQATAVLDIFFDVLALQFLQQLDDIAFRLAKMDVFGKRIKRASVRKCFRAEFEKLPFAKRKKMSIFVKSLYIVNLCGLMAGMAIVNIKQRRGDYHCKSITVQFSDHIWEDAFVLNATGGVEQHDLIYSYFNGVYAKNGTENGRPIYTEQNKFDDTEYQVKIGATIKYCREEGAWVFMHDYIRKDLNRVNPDCPWLLKSSETDSFNLLEVSGDWSIWTGVINPGASFHSYCNSCDSEADCNYHGTCTDDQQCECAVNQVDGFVLYNGMHCQFRRPCEQLAGDNGDLWNLVALSNCNAWKSYGRGVYLHYEGGNFTTVNPEKDQLALVFTGSRWFYTVHENAKVKGPEYWAEFAPEMHPFWDKAYTETTVGVSDPTYREDPIAVDFYIIGRRGEKYGPLGELNPAQEPPGSGYFVCSSIGLQEFFDAIGKPECMNVR